MRNMFAAISAACMLFGVTAAQAATVAYSQIPDSVVANPVADQKTGRVVEGTYGSRPKSRSPWQEDGVDTGVIYTKPTSTYTAVHAGGSATYDVGKSVSASFAWGSPDPHNKLEFLRDGVVIDSYSISRATNIFPATMGRSGAWVVFSSITGGWFDALRFSSGMDSFEYSNLTVEGATVAPVPLPAGGVLLLTGLGGFAWLRRRRATANA